MSHKIEREKKINVKYKLVSGYKFLLTNPWELVIKEPSSNLIIIKDDDYKELTLPKVANVLKKGEFTLEELLQSVSKDKHNDVIELFEYLLRNRIIIESEEDIIYKTKRKINALIVSNISENLTKELIYEYDNILNALEIINIDKNFKPDVISDIISKLNINIELVIYVGVIDTELLESLNNVILEKNLLTLPILTLSNTQAILGPLIIPGRTACLRELMLWLMNAEIIPEEDTTKFAKPLDSFISGNSLKLYKPLEKLIVGYAGEMIIDIITSLESKRKPIYAGKALFIDMDRKIISNEYVLKIPGCDACNRFRKERYSDVILPSSLLIPKQK
mgnify:CR=1 FL=1